jgi:hypothetical protein
MILPHPISEVQSRRFTLALSRGSRAATSAAEEEEEEEEDPPPLAAAPPTRE